MNTYDSTGAVTYQELEKKIRSRYVKPDTDILLPIDNDIKRIMRYQHIDFGNEIPEALIVIHTDLQDYWFAAKISDEYKTFCKNHGIAGVDAKISITDDTILLMPAAIECNGYTFATVWQENSEKGIECFCISNNAYHGYAIFHNGYRLHASHPASLRCDKIIGTYDGMPVYSSGDKYCVATPDEAACICTDPAAFSESGKINIKITGDILTVQEYVYYDCSHHHGGWETAEYNIADAIKNLYTDNDSKIA